MFDRDTTTWISQYGETKLVKDLEDRHVQNIQHYLRNTPAITAKHVMLLALFTLELKHRGLQAVDNQIPHKDNKGNWRVWSFEQRRNVRIENLKEPWP